MGYCPGLGCADLLESVVEVEDWGGRGFFVGERESFDEGGFAEGEVVAVVEAVFWGEFYVGLPEEFLFCLVDK